VKWFNPEKGFGFVEFTEGSGEAFLHISAVEWAGHTALEPGTTLVLRTGQGQKRPQVAEITSVDASAAEPEILRSVRSASSGEPRFSGSSSRGQGRSLALFRAREGRGTVKWYDPRRALASSALMKEARTCLCNARWWSASAGVIYLRACGSR
jgi:CspA family cold shock protein